MGVASGSPPRGRLFLLVAVCVGISGCKTTFNFGDGLIAIPKAQELLNRAPDVAIVVISPGGRVFPKTLIVRKDQHAIVWVSDADSLTVTFTSGPIVPKCEGAICVADAPTAVPEGRGYTYGGTVTKGGVTKPLDPRLEVVP